MEGTPFGRYRLMELLGRGGMGEVWRAQDTAIDRMVALKVLLPHYAQDRTFNQRFRREARAAARLDDPHVVPIYDVGEEEGRLYVTMRLIKGRDLQALIDDGPLEPKRAVAIIDQVATALNAAHRVQLVHRDIKPSNILIADDDFTYLIDFGIARAIGETGLTSTGFTVGTWSYMAPERFRDGQVGPSSDIYALACVLYQCLTGQLPFPGTTFEQVGMAHMLTPPPKPSIQRRGIPAAMDKVIATGMAKVPDQRYATTVELANAAHDAIITPLAATQQRPPGRRPVPHKPRPADRPPAQIDTPTSPSWWGHQRRQVKVALIAATVVILAAAGITGYLLWPHSPASQTQSAGRQPGSTPIVPVPPSCGQGQALLASMSTRDKLAQLLMVGVKNADDARAVVVNQHVGGIFIGSWTDLSIFDGPLADIAANPGPLPLAVSVDEEGGRVSRLKSKIGPAPSPRVLAQTQTVQQVHDLALQRGQAMKKLGITVDFAPVVDVTYAPDETVIGDRSFGSDPAKVTAYAGAFAQGLREAGVLPVLKHFPGYGHGSGDSHTGAVTTPPLSKLQTDDLVPYRLLVTTNPVAVMVGHLQVPELTGNDPASLSRAAVDLLRTGTGYGGPPFDGPVFSDDLSSMAAISSRYGVSEAVLRTLQAGTDIALWVTTDEVPAVLDRLEKALAAGELKMGDIDVSVKRVAAMKGPNQSCGR